MATVVSIKATRIALVFLFLLFSVINIHPRAQQDHLTSADKSSIPDHDQIDSNHDAQAHNKCLPLTSAQEILNSLKPHHQAHLESKITGSISPFGRGLSDGLGWNHDGPLATALRLLPRVLNLVNPVRLLQKIPLPSNIKAIVSPQKGDKRGKTSRARREKIDELFRLIDEAENNGCDEVWAFKAMIEMFPPQGIKQDLRAALNSFQKSVDVTTDPRSQFFVGFFHASGLAGLERNQGKAVLHYTFSALQGYKPAQMAMGYRYWAGIGVTEDCLTSLDFYQSAADQAYARFLDGPPGGETLPLSPSRLSDRAGGIYGPYASWASTGFNAQRAAVKASSAVARGETEREILEYYQYHSDRDSHIYTVRLGRLFYLGSIYFLPGGVSSGAESVGEIAQSYEKAKAYFMKVARVLWPIDFEQNGSVAGKKRMSKEAEDAVREPAMVAAAFLGRMALRGEGQKRDYRRARLWFERAAELGDREAHNGLGIIYRDGLAVNVDLVKAQRYFQAAAGQDLAEAQVNLGKFHISRGEIKQAVDMLESALRHGSPFEAFHLLASIQASSARVASAAASAGDRKSQGRPGFMGSATGMCGVSVAYYKLVAERGAWDDLDFVGEADRAWARGEQDKAMLGWWVAAEMGYEVAQNNVAFMLDKGVNPWHVGKDASLVMWTRSAAQDNVDAMVMVGDYYYRGQHNGSVSTEAAAADYDMALTYYQTAADTSGSSLAYWNLGHMYEHGLGVPQDWHLAKRFYDLSLETSGDAYLPWLLSLIKLYTHSWYIDVTTRGAVKRLPLFEEDPDHPGLWEAAKRLFTHSDFWDYDGEALEEENGDSGYDDMDGHGWGGGNGGGQDDRGRREAADYEEEDLVETVIVWVLGIVVIALFWIRGRWFA